MKRRRSGPRPLLFTLVAGVALANAAPAAAAQTPAPAAAAQAPAPGDGGAAGAAPGQRWLELTNTHTGETVHVSYRNAAGVDRAAVDQLEHVLRDHRRDVTHDMDARLYDLLFDLATSVGKEPRYEIISGYRSPETNHALRARNPKTEVSEHSLHMQGKAIDVRLKGYATAGLRDAALRLGRGGVGYYDRSNFVHVDTGRVRHWSGH